jgi:hypothetical protein
MMVKMSLLLAESKKEAKVSPKEEKVEEPKVVEVKAESAKSKKETK